MFPEGMHSCCLAAQDPPEVPLVLFGLKGQILPHPMPPDACFPPDHGSGLRAGDKKKMQMCLFSKA